MSFAEFLELMGEILTETTRWGNLTTKLDGYVGFDTIQEQIKKKSIKRGFEFNLMMVGEYYLNLWIEWFFLWDDVLILNWILVVALFIGLIKRLFNDIHGCPL